MTMTSVNFQNALLKGSFPSDNLKQNTYLHQIQPRSQSSSARNQCDVTRRAR